MNIIMMTDSYKVTQHNMYPKGTEKVYSYFESRSGAKYYKTLFFGLQYYLKKYLEGKVVTQEKIDEASKFFAGHFNNSEIFNREGWEYILKEYDGYLPIEIRAVKEGSIIKESNVLMTVVNTDERCAWLTNYLETILSQIWYTSTVASASHETKNILNYYLKSNSDSVDGLPFMLHDFGYRGCTSQEAAGLGGAAHLINFLGSDTLAAAPIIEEYYGSTDMPMYSVVATEHSIMTSKGPSGEFEIVSELIEKFPTGVLSVVSDSYDIFKACKEYGTTFKERILARNGTFVVRPDSGNPIDVSIKCLNILREGFGISINSKGFKTLPNKIRLLWGDGIISKDVDEILDELHIQGWSAENMIFGMGGGLLQKCNRDTQKFAFKCSAQKINGSWVDVYKDPIDGGKTSKKGRLSLINGKTIGYGAKNDLLIPVFKNGVILKKYSFDEIREHSFNENIYL